MASDIEQPSSMGGNLPPKVAIAQKTRQFFDTTLEQLRNSDPRNAKLETMNFEPQAVSTGLLSADSITLKGINGFRDVPDQLDGSLELEVELKKDGSPYDPLLEAANITAKIPVILIGPEMPACFTDSDLVQAYIYGHEDTFPKVELSEEDCVQLESVFDNVGPLVTTPDQYGV